MTIPLTLPEIEALLLATAPRDKQDLGKYYDNARQKLTKARNEMLEEAAKQPEFFYGTGNTI